LGIKEKKMKFTAIRARKFRTFFAKNESKLLALNYIKHNKKLSSATRWKASLLLTNLKLAVRSKIASRCSLTLRSRSYLKLFNLSRLKVRELARDGKLPYVNKVSW